MNEKDFKNFRENVRRSIRTSKPAQLKGAVGNADSGMGDLAFLNRLDASLIDNLPTGPVCGQAVKSGNGTITSFSFPHGLGGVPAVWLLTPASLAAKGEHYVTADATNLTVVFTAAPASGTNNLIFNWLATMPAL